MIWLLLAVIVAMTSFIFVTPQLSVKENASLAKWSHYLLSGITLLTSIWAAHHLSTHEVTSFTLLALGFSCTGFLLSIKQLHRLMPIGITTLAFVFVTHSFIYPHMI